MRRWIAPSLAAFALLTALTGLAAAGATAARATGPRPAVVAGTVAIRTVPPTAGVSMVLDGQPMVTDRLGRAAVRSHSLVGVQQRLALAGANVGPDLRVVGFRVHVDPQHGRYERHLVVALDLARPVRLRLTAPVSGAELSPGAVSQLTVRDSSGRPTTLSSNQIGAPVWLQAMRTVNAHGQLVSTRVTWTVQSVVMGRVALRITPRTFDPGTRRLWTVPVGLNGTVQVQVLPALPGVQLQVQGQLVKTGRDGRVTVPVADLHDRSYLPVLHTPVVDADTRVAVSRVSADPAHPQLVRKAVVALTVTRRVRLSFHAPTGAAVPTDRVASVDLMGSTGVGTVLRGAELTEGVWLQASRVEADPRGSVIRPVTYAVQAVMVDGSNAVHRSVQRFTARGHDDWKVSLLLYDLRVQARDALFGWPTASTVRLTLPNGRVVTRALDSEGRVLLPSLARGDYSVTVLPAGVRSTSPLLVSRGYSVTLKVISRTDVAVVLAMLLLICAALIAVGRRRSRPGPRPPRIVKTGRHRVPVPVGLMLLLALPALLVGGPPRPAAAASTAAGSSARAGLAATPALRARLEPGVPAWGYLYQWYTPASWRRAKIDQPVDGNYSSDDPAVLRRQVLEAQQSGLTGFLTSWKHKPPLDRRLSMLASLARETRFGLGVVYEALDFTRKPLPVSTVRGDMAWFADHYAHDPSFNTRGKPIVIWTGIDRYSTADVAAVRSALSGRVRLLAAAKNVKQYERVAPLVDGNAYYWSSADPRQPAVASKLQQMSAAVHARGGLWIAPAAPGYDARKVAGSRVVDRRGGQTFQLSLAAAAASNPDILGVISWNEWSENTYIEPSRRYGDQALMVLSRFLGAPGPQVSRPAASGADGRADGGPDIDSSSSNLGPPWWTGLTAAVVLLFLCLAGGAALTLVRRRRERVGATTDGEPNETSPHPDDQSAVLHGAVTEPRSVPEQRQEF